MVEKRTVEDVALLLERVHETGQGFFHSQPLSHVQTPFEERVPLTLFDWGVIGAISESTTLLTGETDRGKTDFAKIIMSGLFGPEEEGWHKTDVDIDFGSQTYSGNNFSAITGGETTEELFYEKEWLKCPGLIWDEPNRAPAKLLNKLLHILEKDFTLENGRKVKSGYERNDARYQYHMLAMNEGNGYHGTNEVDAALRRRQTLEIPIDIFQTTMADKLNMSRERTGSLDITQQGSLVDKVIDVHAESPKIPISPQAEHLKLYLQAMSYCDKSLTKDKWGINFNESICQKSVNSGEGTHVKGCHYRGAYPNNMCPNVYGLTDGVAINLNSVARAHALVRSIKTLSSLKKQLHMEEGEGTLQERLLKRRFNKETLEKLQNYVGENISSSRGLAEKFTQKFIEELSVQAQDIHSVLPFVAHSKMHMNPHWVKKTYQGSSWYAVTQVCGVAYSRISSLYKNHPELHDAIRNGGIDDETRDTIIKDNNNDIWLQRTLEAYRPQSKNQNYTSVTDLLDNA